MDSNKLILLNVDLNAQMNDIREIHEKIIHRAKKLDYVDEIIFESIAYQIHNIYYATEDLLKIVAKYFENNISDSSQWYSLLLQRMSTDIPNIRPNFFSHDTYLLLNSLRGFRIFVCHAYGISIEYEQLKVNLDKSLNLVENLNSDLKIFITKLSPKEVKHEAD